MTQEEIDNLKKENETLKLLLWDYFIMANMTAADIDQNYRDRMLEFFFNNGSHVPFGEKSKSANVVRICNKVPKDPKWT